jgi:phytoene dehydrogenase-like protein
VPASLRDAVDLLRTGYRYRALGRSDMTELLRMLAMPVADLLDDTFESPRLKGALAALAVTDLGQGPLSGGTVMSLLHRQVGAGTGVFGERLRLAAGPGALIAALAERARLAGVTVETGTAAAAWLVEAERVAGVRLASGEEVGCRQLLSALDPQTSLLEMLDPAWLDPDLVSAVRNIRRRGVTSYLLCALDALPDLPGPGAPPAGSLWIAPSIHHVERAADAAKYGRCSDEPVIELRFPSVVQPGLAPEGRHVAVLRLQFTPRRLREGRWEDQRDALADRVLSGVERELPGFAARIRARAVLTPADLEARFGLAEGAVSRGETLLDQMLFMRPVPGCARHAAPLPGLWLCGAGTYPGPGLTGLSGLLAARAMLGR